MVPANDGSGLNWSPVVQDTAPVPVAARVPVVSAAEVTAPLVASSSSQVWLDVRSTVCTGAETVPGNVTRYVLTTPPVPIVNRSGVPSPLMSAACGLTAVLAFHVLEIGWDL